jgi:indole-3-glycerol phosphate synthase
MFLNIILEHRRLRPTPDPAQLAEWHQQALAAPVARNFSQALSSGPKPRIIAEFKRASPSKGLLNSQLDPALQAQAYAAGGARALSVLTEENYFQGSLADLQAARAATELPVLRKDFLLEDWEIAQSRAYGADAVLLIAAALPPERMRRMLELCQTYAVAALVEVHSLEEARAIAPWRPGLVGINNRNLENFQVDLATTRAILPELHWDCIKVAESGFETPEQLAEFGQMDAFLIGETLVKSQDPRQCLHWLCRKGMP